MTRGHQGQWLWQGQKWNTFWYTFGVLLYTKQGIKWIRLISCFTKNNLVGYTVLKNSDEIHRSVMPLSSQYAGQRSSWEQTAEQVSQTPQILQFWTNISTKWDLPVMIFTYSLWVKLPVLFMWVDPSDSCRSPWRHWKWSADDPSLRNPLSDSAWCLILHQDVFGTQGSF